MVKICQTGLQILNFEIIPKKRIFRFLPKISAGHAWSWKFFFANFQILGPLGCQGWVVIPQNVKKSQNHCTLVYIQDSPRLFVSTACKILWEFRKFSLQNIRSAWRVIYNNNINKILHLFIEVSVVQWIRAGMQRVRSTVQSYYLLDFFCNNIFFQKDAC